MSVGLVSGSDVDATTVSGEPTIAGCVRDVPATS
jgi:hypothetical protein